MDESIRIHNDDQDVIDAGYRPQLQRRIGFFASFAISFSFMSVLMGVFANYSYVLGKAGPFGLWTWLIVGVGQLLVAFVFAEMAGRIPLTGALYNWNGKLGHPTVSWLVGWLTIFAYAAGSVGIVVALMNPLQSLIGKTLSMSTISLIGVGILVLELVINVYGVRFAAYINKVAVIAEIVALIVFGLILGAVVLFKGQANPSLLTTIPSNFSSYLPVFLISTLLAAWTIFGFESPSDFSEETINAKQIAPKSIITSVLTAVLLGAFFLGVVTIAIPNLANVTSAADPISTIFTYHLGVLPTEIFLFCVVLAMFAASLITTTAASRILFAVSRDENFIGHQYFSRVSGRGIPFYAALLIAIVEGIIFLTMYGLSALYSAAVVLLFLAYLITVINFAVGLKKLPPTKNFSLGSWHYPVVTLSILWLIFQIGVLTIPAEFHLAAEVTGGIIVIGLVLYSLQSLFISKKQITS